MHKNKKMAQRKIPEKHRSRPRRTWFSQVHQDETKQLEREGRGKITGKLKAYVHRYVYDGQVLKI